MAELTQTEMACSPRSLQVWSLLNWLAFFLRIFVQILRALVRHPLLSSSSTTDGIKPLPAVELSERESPVTIDLAAGIYSDDEDEVEKLTVVLDMDETLVRAYETSSLPVSLRNQATEAGLKWFEFEYVSSDKEFEGKPKIKYVTVFERPGLEEFIKQVSEFADIVLFTAGNEEYARPLVDRIDVENRFSLRLYRSSTIRTKYWKYVKDLSCLSKNLRRTVIVDDNPRSFLLQPLNGIPCVRFSAERPYDKFLDDLLPLLKHLSQLTDVRPLLHELFHMPEWFQEHGLPFLFGSRRMEM